MVETVILKTWISLNPLGWHNRFLALDRGEEPALALRLPLKQVTCRIKLVFLKICPCHLIPLGHQSDSQPEVLAQHRQGNIFPALEGNYFHAKEIVDSS